MHFEHLLKQLVDAAPPSERTGTLSMHALQAWWLAALRELPQSKSIGW